MQSKQGRPAPFIWSSLYPALRWHKTASACPRNWDTCCCNPGCAKVPEKKVWAEGGEISAHARHHPPSSLKKLWHHSARWNTHSKSGQSWGLLAFFLNRLCQLCSKKGCVKDAGCSNTRDIRDLIRLRGRPITLIGVYHFRWEGGFLTWGFFGLGSHGSYSCSGNLIIAFLGFSNFAPSSVDPLSPHRTWGQESTL